MRFERVKGRGARAEGQGSRAEGLPLNTSFVLIKLVDKKDKNSIFFIPMEFEFDEKKSRSNKHKHGIDFDEAQALWDDPGRVEIPARTVDESRLLLIGQISKVHWSVIITYRHPKIRIISARRSRKEEIEIYES